VTVAELGVDFRVVVVLAVLAVIALALGYRLLNRDPTVRRTRYGFFVERDRYDEEEPPEDEQTPPWPQPPRDGP
jgi:hypothetical protein